MITIFVSFTGQHENEAQSGNYCFRLFLKLFMKKNFWISLTLNDIRPSYA